MLRHRPLRRAAAAATLALALAPAAAAAQGRLEVRAPDDVPAHADFGVYLSLVGVPGAAGVQADVLVDGRAAELIGVANVARASRPLGPVAAGAARRVAIVGFRSGKGRVALGGLALDPQRNGRIEVVLRNVRVVDARGRTLRVKVVGARQVVHVGASRAFVPAPRAADVRAPRALRGASTRIAGVADADRAFNDGVADVAAVVRAPRAKAAGRALAAVELEIVVDSNGDQPDALTDGTCATALGTCTLRAAIAESQARNGDERITFNIPGGAPQVITVVNGTLPALTQSRVIIDGTTQPGAVVNTSPTVSNAIPGIELRGPGRNTAVDGLYITSPNNIIRGLAITAFRRGLWLYGGSADSNTIVGNFIGISATGTFIAAYQLTDGMKLDNGPSSNRIGTPALADRNVLVRAASHGIEMYGPGSTDNLLQNNIVGITPSGALLGVSGTAIDHNFGARRNVSGGFGPNEKNVVAGSGLVDWEASHGWDPAKAPRADYAELWNVVENRAVGNWFGFKADGSYDPLYRGGRCYPGCVVNDNGNAVNMIDGSYRNVAEGNYMSALRNGAFLYVPANNFNVIRNNVIGIAPNGSPAPINDHGVQFKWGPSDALIEGNTIANVGKSGIAVESTGSVRNRLSRNLISNVGWLGIDLYPLNAVNANDVGDADSGANFGQNFPEIATALPAKVTGTACGGCTVEVFKANGAAGANGNAVAYLGSAVAAVGGTWQVAVAPGALVPGDVVTSTATSTVGSTSEYSVNIAVATPPPPDAPVAVDAFSRTVAGGWGAADTGGAWTIGGTAADFAVAGGVATMRLPTAVESRNAYLNTVAIRDVSTTTQLAVSTLPVGGSVTTTLVVRRVGSNQLRFNVRVAPDGGVFAQIRRATSAGETAVTPEVRVTGLVAAAGVPLAMRAEAIGNGTTALNLRVWAAASAEPATWTLQASDATAALQVAGAVGYRLYAGTTMTSVPMTVSVDALEARPAV